MLPLELPEPEVVEDDPVAPPPPLALALLEPEPLPDVEPLPLELELPALLPPEPAAPEDGVEVPDDEPAVEG